MAAKRSLKNPVLINQHVVAGLDQISGGHVHGQAAGAGHDERLPVRGEKNASQIGQGPPEHFDK